MKDFISHIKECYKHTTAIKLLHTQKEITISVLFMSFLVVVFFVIMFFVEVNFWCFLVILLGFSVVIVVGSYYSSKILNEKAIRKLNIGEDEKRKLSLNSSQFKDYRLSAFYAEMVKHGVLNGKNDEYILDHYIDWFKKLSVNRIYKNMKLFLIFILSIVVKYQQLVDGVVEIIAYIGITSIIVFQAIIFLFAFSNSKYEENYVIYQMLKKIKINLYLNKKTG